MCALEQSGFPLSDSEGRIPEIGKCGGDVGDGETDAVKIFLAGNAGDLARKWAGGEDSFPANGLCYVLAGSFGRIGDGCDYAV